jgi:ribosomal protein S21
MPRVEPKRVGYKGKYEESFDKMLRRWSRAVNRAGIVTECRKRQFHVKPNEIRNSENSKLKRKKKLAKFKLLNEGRSKHSRR